MKPLISIQILNWNRAEETQWAIKSATEQSYSNIEIVMVDNGSTDNSVSLTKSNFPNVKIVQLDKNYGCPGGRNKGIQHCNGDYIFYADNDGLLHQKAVENAYRNFERDTSIGIVTGQVYDFVNLKEVDTKCDIENTQPFRYNDFQGGICLHKKEIYKVVGEYPTHFMYGAEESFMALKLFSTGFSIIKDKSVVLWHKKSLQSRNKNKELLYLFFNKLYVALTTYPLLNALVFFFYFIIVYPFFAKKQGFLLFYLKSFPSMFAKTIKKSIKDRDPISTQDYKIYRSLDNNV